jgi:hypothetical protein
MSRSRASRITDSVRESIEEVGSSRTRIGASRRKARATEMRWRSPPEILAPALAEERVVALGKAGDEVVRVGRPRRLLDLLRGSTRASVDDVLGDAPREEQRLLEHDAVLRAQRREREVAHVVTVDAHAPVRGVVEAGQQAGERRLAGAGRPTMATALPIGTVKLTPLQRVGPALVAERHVVEGQRASGRRQGDRIGGLVDLRRRVQQLEGVLERDEVLLELRHRARQHLERRVHTCHVGEHDEQLAAGDVTVEHLVGADAEDGRRCRAR